MRIEYYICVAFVITVYKSKVGYGMGGKYNFDQPLGGSYLRTKNLDFQYEFLLKNYLFFMF